MMDAVLALAKDVCPSPDRLFSAFGISVLRNSEQSCGGVVLGAVMADHPPQRKRVREHGNGSHKVDRSAALRLLASEIDAGGSLAIKKRTFDSRKHKGIVSPTYSERVTVKRVDPDLPLLMQQVFGGRVYLDRPSKAGTQPRHVYDVTERRAVHIVTSLLPYLQVKRRQAELLLELRRWKEQSQARQFTWWWVNQHPGWKRMAMMTSGEVVRALDYANTRSVIQARRFGVLVGLPAVVAGRRVERRFPRLLVQTLASLMRRHGHRALMADPPPLLDTYEQLYQAVRLVNRKALIGRMFRADGTESQLCGLSRLLDDNTRSPGGRVAAP